MKNGKLVGIFSDINYLLDCSTNKTYKIQDSKTGQIIEVKEIKQYLELPVQISSTIIRNKIEIKTIVDKKDEIVKEALEKYKLDKSYDEEKYNSDEEYKTSFDEDVEKYMSSKESPLYIYLEEDSEVKFKKVKLNISENVSDKTGKYLHLKKIDPKGLFKINYIPFSLFESEIIEIVDL